MVTPSGPVLRNAGGSRGLAITQIVFGVILMLLEIVGLGLGTQIMDVMTMTGAGIWCGVLFIVTGVLGVFAHRTAGQLADRKCTLIASMIMSIFCSIQTFGMLVYGMIALILGSDYCWLYYYHSCNSYDSSYNWMYYNCQSYTTAFFVLRGLSFALYFVQFILFIISACFGCCNVCQTTTTPTTYVAYQGQPQQVYGQQYPYAQPGQTVMVVGGSAGGLYPQQQFTQQQGYALYPQQPQQNFEQFPQQLPPPTYMSAVTTTQILKV